MVCVCDNLRCLCIICRRCNDYLFRRSTGKPCSGERGDLCQKRAHQWTDVADSSAGCQSLDTPHGGVRRAESWGGEAVIHPPGKLRHGRLVHAPETKCREASWAKVAGYGVNEAHHTGVGPNAKHSSVPCVPILEDEECRPRLRPTSECVRRASTAW